MHGFDSRPDKQWLENHSFLQYPLGGGSIKTSCSDEKSWRRCKQHDSGALQRAEAARRNGETRLLSLSGRVDAGVAAADRDAPRRMRVAMMRAVFERLLSKVHKNPGEGCVRTDTPEITKKRRSP